MLNELLEKRNRLQKVETTTTSTIDLQQIVEQDKLLLDYQRRLKEVAVEEWYPWLQKHTFPTVFLNLSRDEAESIVECYVNYLRIRNETQNPTTLPVLSSPILIQLESRINDNTKQWEECGFFARLSSRSPKYSDVALIKSKNYIKSKIEELKKLSQNMDKKQIYNAKQIAIFEATLHGLHCKDGKEALLLLCSSSRIYDDLTAALKEQNFNINLILRQWIEIPVHLEFRLFINNNNLNVLIQNWDHLYFAEFENGVFKELADRMKTFFESTIQPLIPLSSYVLDFAVVGDEIKVIELNPFGETAGAAPFSWNDPEDKKILLNGPYTIRKVDEVQMGGHDEVLKTMECILDFEEKQ